MGGAFLPDASCPSYTYVNGDFRASSSLPVFHLKMKADPAFEILWV
jgi:hypothetical protein